MAKSISSLLEKFRTIYNMWGGEAKKTITLAIPIAFGEIAQMALHLLDTAMVGAVSYKHLAACALVMNVVNIPFVLGIGITFAVSQMVSLANGKNDKQLVSHYFFNGMLLSTLFAILISGILYFNSSILTHLGQDPEVVALAMPFMELISLSMFPMIVFMALKQFTDGLEFTKTAMILSVVAVPLNALINYGLIFGNFGLPRLELIGAGYGTLITRIVITIILALVIWYHKNFRKYVLIRASQWKFNLNTQKELLRIGLPSSLQVTMEAGAFAISGIIIGTIGAQEQAAHQIALSIASASFMVSMGLAQAGSIRTSNAFGQQNGLKISNIGKSTLVTALAFGIICLTLFIIFRNQLPLLFNDNQQVITIAAGLLLWAAVFQISDSTQVVAAGLLRGLKDVKMPTIYIAIAYWIIGIPIGYYLAFYQGFGATGIWIGFILGLSSSALLLTMRFLYFSKKYSKKTAVV